MTLKAKPLLPYPGAELFKNWEKLISKSREEVQELQKEFDKTYIENQAIFKENIETKKALIEQAAKAMADVGIDVYKYKNLKWSRQKNGYAGWFNTNVVKPLDSRFGIFMPSRPSSTSVQVVHGVTVDISGNLGDLLAVYDKVKAQYNFIKDKESKSNAKYQKRLKYAKENNIVIPEGLSIQQVINLVDEAAREIYYNKNVVDGIASEIDFCDECDVHITGQPRCSCGNRRVSIEVDGDLEMGFYWYPVGC